MPNLTVNTRRMNAADAGLKGDGVTDDHDALVALWRDAPDGSTIWLEPSHWYRLEKRTDLPAKNLTIESDGTAGFLQGANIDMLTISGDYGDGVNLSQLKVTTLKLGDGDPFRSTVAQFTAANVPHEWEPGVRIKLVADDQIPGTHRRGDSIMRLGEIVTIARIDGNVVSLGGIPLDWEQYSRNVRAYTQPTVTTTFRGVRFAYSPEGESEGWYRRLLILRGLTNPVLDAVTVDRAVSKAIEVGSCDGLSAENVVVRNAIDDPSKGRYGYGISLLGSTQNARVENATFDNCRHGFTTDTIETSKDRTNAFHYGSVKYSEIINSRATNCASSGFDLHTGARYVTFRNCKADRVWRTKGIGAGFQIRGQWVRLEDCEAFDCSVGFFVTDQASIGGAGDVEFNNCRASRSRNRALVVAASAGHGAIKGVSINGGYYEETLGDRVIELVNADLTIQGARVVSHATTPYASLFRPSGDSVTISLLDVVLDLRNMDQTARAIQLSHRSQRVEIHGGYFYLDEAQKVVAGTKTGGHATGTRLTFHRDVVPSDLAFGLETERLDYWAGDGWDTATNRRTWFWSRT